MYRHASGPSPHAWGLHGSSSESSGTGRAIPTCVGTTSRRSPGPGPGPGHPHMRGDYGGGLTGFGLGAGHPHMRGDYASTAGEGGEQAGPSPHAWGLRGYVRPQRPGPRAIPTCVGTTSGWGGSSGLGAGHPHMRGDYRPGLTYSSRWSGPSPHAWGLRGRPSRSCPGLGPSPHAWGLRSYAKREACGIGPSPHAWGLLFHPPSRAADPRAIPTCVGTTPWPSLLGL